MRRLLLTLGLVVIAGLAYRVLGQSARPRLLWPVSGRVVSPLVADGRWIGWLEEDDDACHLVIAPRGGGAHRTVLSRKGLSGLAMAGDYAFVAQTEAGPDKIGGALVQVALPGGSTAKIASLASVADEIISSEGWLVWRSTSGPALPGVRFVVAAAPLTVIHARRVEGGSLHVVAVVPCDDISTVTEVDLLGVLSEEAYWLERGNSARGLRTRVRRAPCEGGDPDTVVEEPGRRTAALESNTLGWTAPSLDAGEANSCASVKRLRIDESEPQVIADWLSPSAVVLLSQGRVYAQDSSGLWRLGSQRKDQRRLFSAPVGVRAVSAIGDQELLVMWQQGRSAVAARPLTWWARTKAAVSF